MALTNDQITAQNFKAFFDVIKPYLNFPTMGFTPIGTVISVMGTMAPMNYLVCDGTVYNIVDHLELANYFKEQFGSVNKFGGDGTTTFAVPDLRGEFLRGTGTNSHTDQGSGGNVGDHQDATEINHNLVLKGSSNNFIAYSYADKSAASSSIIGPYNKDAIITKPSVSQFNSAYTTQSDLSNNETYYSTRPTNTSVLYCIAEKNIFIENYEASNLYSTDERVIGQWIDGKPLYQQSFIGKTPSTVNTGTDFVVFGDNVRENFIIVNGYVFDGVTYRPINSIGWTVWCNSTTIRNSQSDSAYLNMDAIVTIQYTKTTD